MAKQPKKSTEATPAAEAAPETPAVETPASKPEKGPSAAELKKALDAANAKIAKMEAASGSAISSDRAEALAARKGRKRKFELTLEDHKKTRAEMKELALTEGGNKLFRVGMEGAYRDGRVYAPGETIRLPIEEDPSITWEPITSKIEAKRAAVAEEAMTMSGMQKGKGTRPADTQIG